MTEIKMWPKAVNFGYQAIPSSTISLVLAKVDIIKSKIELSRLKFKHRVSILPPGQKLSSIKTTKQDIPEKPV